MNNAVRQRGNEIIRRLPSCGTMAEVGVRDGRLSKYILENSHTTINGIDNWASSDDRPASYRATGDKCALWTSAEAKYAYTAAQEVYSAYPLWATLHRGDSAESASLFPDGHFNLVFIDADHSYEGTKRDITAWLPKVKLGGFIGGHDFGNYAFDFGVDRAVLETFDLDSIEFGENFTWFVRIGG